jgi:hypothetical protein
MILSKAFLTSSDAVRFSILNSVFLLRTFIIYETGNDLNIISDCHDGWRCKSISCSLCPTVVSHLDLK